MKITQGVHTTLSTLLIVFSLGILGAFGCNTVHGVGQDIERAGEKTQGMRQMQ